MESVIGKAIDLVCQYTVIPIARQLQYVKARVEEMNDAINKLQNEKEIADREKTTALHNMRLIHKKTEDWLEAVTKTQDEVNSLIMTNQQEMTSGCIIGGQIVNPIARHKLGRKATKKKQAIEDLRRDRPQHDHDISYAPPPPGIVDHQATSSDAAAAAKQQTDDGIFRSSRWKEIMEEIMVALKDERNNVVGLYGMGGVGKSTMINEVYDQVKKQCMFDEVIKVEVKVKPEIRRIQEEIAFALGLKFENESPAIRAKQLNQRLLRKKDENNDKDQKKKKSVLIILDDLWVKLNLQEVGIPSDGNDQVYIKLFLTSRREDVLSDKMGARNPIHLDVLSDVDALRMFRFVVGVGDEGVNDEKVTEISRKCSGLPIVIEATAKALKDRALDEWEKILKRLDNDDVLQKLKVSYDYLPSKESKDLFLICGVVRGPRIPVKDLLKYTFGLRLFNRKDSSTLRAAAAKLEEFLSHLEDASMLLKSDDSRYVKMHDHMRELAIKIVAEDHPEWAHDVTFADNSYCELIPDASELKLLLSCWEGDAVELGDSFLKDMKKLNVLECRNFRFALAFPSSKNELDHLRNLGTLCLHNCCLNDISMIGELKGLQILSFQGSDIRKLPIQLRELTILKMLDLSDCKELTQIEPNVLGSLTKLEELNMENSFNVWDIDQEDDVPPRNARLIELKNMSRLSNVRIHIPSTSMLPKEGQIFSSKLSMYQIVVGDNGYYRNYRDEYIKFSRVLMLTLDKYSSDIVWQDWVQTTLQTAEVLYLSGYEDGKCESISKMCTKGFDCLKNLRITICPSFLFIISSNGDSFTNLESLFIDNLESLEKLYGGLPRHEEAFSKLKVMNVNDCKKLTHLFDFSLLERRLSSQLEEMTVIRCPEIQCIVVSEGANNCDVVTLSNLQKLNFISLRKFSSFCAAGPSSNVLFTGKKVTFPCLESLMIVGLDELEHIWDPTDPPTELGKLRFLLVDDCDKLVRVINSSVLMRLQRHLESLSVCGCGSMKEVFDLDDVIISTDEEHDLVFFSKLNGLSMANMGGLESVHNIKNLMMIEGGRSTMKMFPNIEWLDVSECPHLRYMLCCPVPTTAGVRGEYENLKQIKIEGCNKMETVVMLRMVDQETQPAATTGRDAHHHQNYDHTVSISYSSLKTISIKGCHQLRTFYQYLCSQQDSVVDDLPFFSQKEIFPCLESLELSDLSNKSGKIWPHEVPSDQRSFKMLKDVTIEKCAQLSVVFPSTLIPRLEKLTELKVEDCKQMIQIIVQGGGGSSNGRIIDEEESMKMMFTFPHLKKLELKGLPKLERFYSSSSASACGFQFPSLETLYIWHCIGVKTLFSHDSDPDMVGALFISFDTQLAIPPNLKYIDLDHLEDLTKIWKGEKPQGLLPKLESLRWRNSSSSCTNLQSLFSVGVATSTVPCWNALTRLIVYSCDGLEYLLTPGGASSLVHLTRLYIGFCKNIKEVVVAAAEEEEKASATASNEEITIRRDRDDHHIPDMITFPNLQQLQLLNLPKLAKFSSPLISVPCLDYLDIWKCPNMTTFISGGLTTSTPKFGDLNSFVQKVDDEVNVKERYFTSASNQG